MFSYFSLFCSIFLNMLLFYLILEPGVVSILVVRVLVLTNEIGGVQSKNLCEVFVQKELVQIETVQMKYCLSQASSYGVFSHRAFSY